jgi:hypothetical protein
MTSRDFCFWVQGFAEVSEDVPTAKQWQIIKKHLAMVFKYEIDPSIPDPSGALQNLHDGVTSGAVPVDGTTYRC